MDELGLVLDTVAGALRVQNLKRHQIHAGLAAEGEQVWQDLDVLGREPALSAQGDSRPFDRDGDGTILGEGIGMLVFKRLADAEKEGNRIYCVLKGIGTSSDGRGKSIYAPSASGQKKCLEDAYKQAGVAPSTVGLVEAHGTGTKVGDAIEELSALLRHWQQRDRQALEAAIDAYHARRAQLVPRIVAALEDGRDPRH